MGGDHVSRTEVRPVLIYVRLVGVLVTRIHNIILKYPSYNLPLIYILGVVEVGNDFIDESVFKVHVYSPTSLLLIVTVTPIIIGSVDISGTRYKSSSVILNMLSLTEHVSVVGGVFVTLN